MERRAIEGENILGSRVNGSSSITSPMDSASTISCRVLGSPSSFMIAGESWRSAISLVSASGPTKCDLASRRSWSASNNAVPTSI